MAPPNIENELFEKIGFGITAGGIYLPIKVVDDGTGKGKVVTSGGAGGLTSTNFTGSNAGGSDGDTGRILATGVTPILVVLEREFLHPLIDFTISGSNVTFLVNLFNFQRITIWS